MSYMDMAPTEFSDWEFGVAAATTIEGGEQVAVNAAGWLVPASAATGLLACGIAKKTVVNAGANGSVVCPVMTSSDKRRVFPVKNSATDPVLQTSLLRDCFLEDENTVAETSSGGTLSRAGKVWGFDAKGNVLVEFDLDSDATALATLDSRVDALELTAISMQAVNATLVAGTVTINSGITVSAASEVQPLLIGAITGSTNFAGLSELKASRVNGAPGVGSIVVRALGADGALDADAAGAIRVLIFTPVV